ncbi:hypothetical protein PMAYCL1PPCAC_10607, partial [Pristionchus mayeri]
LQQALNHGEVVLLMVQIAHFRAISNVLTVAVDDLAGVGVVMVDKRLKLGDGVHVLDAFGELLVDLIEDGQFWESCSGEGKAEGE